MVTRRDFLKIGAGATAAAIIPERVVSVAEQTTGHGTHSLAGSKPNIILILADDMGYSDIGCFGSEISTPNLDRLASQGLKLTQFYNSGRCCPSRTALLTGLYPHQAGVGDMLQNDSLPGYGTHLNYNS